MPDFDALFTRLEKEHIIKAKTVTMPPSLFAYIFLPFWEFIAKQIPATVAPNAITAMGLVFSVQAFHVTNQYYAANPMLTSVVAVVLLSLCVTCSAVDGLHALNNRSATPLGPLMLNAVSGIRPIFFTLTVMQLFGVHDVKTVWYMVQATQLVNFIDTIFRVISVRKDNVQKKISADVKSLPHKSHLFTANEVFSFLIMLYALRLMFPDIVVRVSTDHAATAYYTLTALSLGVVATMGKGSEKEGIQRRHLVLCLVFRLLPAVILPLSDTAIVNVISDGLVIGVLSTEVYVASLAQRAIAPIVIMICMTSMLNSILTFAMVCGYLVVMFAELSLYGHIPLFTQIRNVYIDGVFDLCHIGHKRLMEYALQFGNRLVVGIMGDEDCKTYKRPPIMTEEERQTEVLACKYVSQVIMRAPCFGLTEEFLLKHNIHVVVYGEEYHRDDDKYYAAARRMGIERVKPRTAGMSTSELIRRVRAASDRDVAAKDKESGQSTVKE